MKLTTLLFLALLSLGAQADNKFAFINAKALLEKSPQAIAANTVSPSRVTLITTRMRK